LRKVFHKKHNLEAAIPGGIFDFAAQCGFVPAEFGNFRVISALPEAADFHRSQDGKIRWQKK
jgi:hypothetical protein